MGEKPKGWDLADYVLSRFSAEDRKVMDESVAAAGEAIKLMLESDINAAMNKYNTKKK